MAGIRSRNHPWKAGISKSELLFVLLIIGVVIIFLLPAIQQERNSGRNPCKNNLKTIGLALHNYHDTYGSLPPAVVHGPDGQPWHSWRVLILPYLEEQKLYDRYRFDEPWNGPHNRRLAKEADTLPVFHCYADKGTGPGSTSYVAVTGEGTLWPLDQSVSFDDVPDGLSNTILVVEMSGSGIHWMSPRDLSFDETTFEIGGAANFDIRSRHGGTKRWYREDAPPVAGALLGDGSVRWLGGLEMKPETVRSLLLRDDGGPEENWYR